SEPYGLVEGALCRLVVGAEDLLAHIVVGCEYSLDELASDAVTLESGPDEDVLQVHDGESIANQSRESDQLFVRASCDDAQRRADGGSQTARISRVRRPSDGIVKIHEFLLRG